MINRLRDLFDEGVPLIASSFTDQDGSETLSDAVEAGLDIVEARIDLFADQDAGAVSDALERMRAAPLIGTIRSRFEGGGWVADDDARLPLFQRIASLVDAVDIELSSDIAPTVIDGAKSAGALAIVSYHDFDDTRPYDELQAIAKRAVAAGADVVKIATTVQTETQMRDLARLLVEPVAEDMIVIGMGERGGASRTFFPLLGSKLTFAKVNASSAPGQVDFAEMMRLLRLFSPPFERRKKWIF